MKIDFFACKIHDMLFVRTEDLDIPIAVYKHFTAKGYMIRNQTILSIYATSMPSYIDMYVYGEGWLVFTHVIGPALRNFEDIRDSLYRKLKLHTIS